ACDVGSVGKGSQDRGGGITSVTVAGSGLSKVVTPDGSVTTLAYGLNNTLVAWVNPLGQRSTVQYSSGNVQALISPLGERTTFGSLVGAQRGIVDARGQRSTVVYSAASNRLPLAVVNPLGQRSSYTRSSNRLPSAPAP